MKKWKYLSNELHETTLSLKNEFQETSLAATLNLGSSNVNDDKMSSVLKPDISITTETVESDNHPPSDENNLSYLSDSPTFAY